MESTYSVILDGFNDQLSQTENLVFIIFEVQGASLQKSVEVSLLDQVYSAEEVELLGF